MTGTLSVGSGDSATLINSTAISFGTRFTIVDQSGQTTMVFQKTAGQSSGNKGFHIQSDGSNTILRGGDVSNAGPFSPTWSITCTTGNATFGDVLVGDDLTVTDRLYIGASDCELFRDSANVIKTPDSLIVGDDLIVTDRLYIGTTDCEFYRDAADVIRTPDAIQAQGFGAYGALAAYAATSADVVFFASYAAATCFVKAVPFTVYDSSNVAKFSVAHATGNTTIAGTLGVSGNTTLSGSLSVSGAVTSAMTFNSTVAITGSLTVGASGTIYLGADCEIARTAVNTITTPDLFVATSGLQTSGDMLVYSGGDKCRIQASNGAVLIQGNAVLGVRQTGWGTPSGTLDRASFDASTVTLSELGERVAALITDLRTHGMIGN